MGRETLKSSNAGDYTRARFAIAKQYYRTLTEIQNLEGSLYDLRNGFA